MDNIISEKIAIGISACNFGCPVRYNKKGWDQIKFLQRESNDFKWHPVCPEVMSGMSVPRDAIKIVGGNGADVWAGKARVKTLAGKDVTEDLKRAAMLCYETLERANVKAYAFMEGSPSCGVYRTTLKNKRLGSPPGVFGALLLEKGFFLIPALDMQSPVKWWDWRRRLHAFMWMKEAKIEGSKDVYEIWHIMKFLCQEISRKEADIIGKELANMPKPFTSQYAEEFRETIMLMLRRPSTLPKIKQSLWKNYIYYKRKSGKTIDEVKPPESARNMTAIAKELITVERAAFENGVLFGATPILYRSKKQIDSVESKTD